MERFSIANMEAGQVNALRSILKGVGKAIVPLCWLVLVPLDFRGGSRLSLYICSGLAVSILLFLSWRLLEADAGRRSAAVTSAKPGLAFERLGELIVCVIVLALQIALWIA